MTTETAPTRAENAGLEVVAPDVFGLRVLIANLFFVGEARPGAPWILVDAGMFSCAAQIQAAADALYGPDARPAAIVLTHGHFDHVGALEELATKWDVPVYAHPLELSYISGHAKYPPPDPAVGGGAMAQASPLYPRAGANVGERAKALPEDGSVPAMPEWKWIHTPGHTPGHISLFRKSDRALIAGDAFVTTQQESALAVLQQARKVSRPPAYYTGNWQQARESVEKLAALDPQAVGTGHGHAMNGDELRDGLRTLVRDFDDAIPKGRFYAEHPVRVNALGLPYTQLPPDPLPPFLLKVGGVALGAFLVAKWASGRNKNQCQYAYDDLEDL